MSVCLSLLFVMTLFLCELFAATWGLFFPVTLMAVHYLLAEERDEALFFLFLAGILLDFLYGLPLPFTMMVLGGFGYVCIVLNVFALRSVRHPGPASAWVAGIALMPMCLWGCWCAPFSFMTVLEYSAFWAFGVVLNLLLTPFCFRIFEFFQVRCGVKSRYAAELILPNALPHGGLR